MISEKLRRVENLHIIFWLIKDASWCLLWRPLGVAMVIPTILIALWIVIKLRKNIKEFAYNLAVLFWISANSTWMIGEFYCDKLSLDDNCTRPYAIVLFASGIAVIVLYNSRMLYSKFHKQKEIVQ
jgi:dolichol kinase